MIFLQRENCISFSRLNSHANTILIEFKQKVRKTLSERFASNDKSAYDEPIGFQL